ncbi:MAG: beta-N-acetylhexosaminidase [Pseudomonadota bacterium]
MSVSLTTAAARTSDVAPTTAMITGVAGTTLTPDERSFLARHRPAGLILFRRNCETPAQLRALVEAFRDACGADILVLVDQEGGRVQRLRPPGWRRLPPAAALARAYEADAPTALRLARDLGRLMAHELRRDGINVNCVPVLDVPVAGAHNIIGTRALGRSTQAIIALGRALAEAHLEQNVLPVIKHVPGHGRAMVDSHVALPRVDASRATLEAQDFVPFAALNTLPIAMTAHIVYAALDPERPATQSPLVIADVVRGQLAFEGLLLSDDISMKALAGDLTSRTGAARAAGCDIVLHCNGELDEMHEVAAGAGLLRDASLARYAHARQLAHQADEARKALRGDDEAALIAAGEEAIEALASYETTAVAQAGAEPSVGPA